MRRGLLATLLAAHALTASAATLHVWQNSPSPAPPYTSWASAATNIQDAIDAAVPGDNIVVTNGVYATGGRMAGVGDATNRVAVTKPVTVRSVNGPDVTVIHGHKTPGADAGVGPASVRCVYLASGATLVGFTLTNGAAIQGGGILCESITATVSNSVMSGNSAGYGDGGGAHGGTLYRCTIAGNVALGDGGGADRGVLINCLITKNTADRGGGVDDSTLYGCIVADNTAARAGGGTLQSTLYNCTVTGNSAHRNGGVASKRFNGEAAYNCIIYGNKAALAPNYGEDDYSKVILHHCCTTPLPSLGEGNIDSDPLLLSANRIAAASPCIGAGATAYATGVDIDGQPWRNPPSMGADEIAAGTATGPLSVVLEAEFTNVAPAYVSVFKVALEGLVTSNYWTLGDGTVLANGREVEHAWAAPGNFPVTVTAFNDSHPAGVSATVMVQVVNAPIHYVNLVNATPSFPFTSWPTAATNIQDAIGAGIVAGRRVVVTNGVYDTGGTVVFGSLSNRIALTNGVLVESVNGPSVTIIRGGSDFGDTAIRCAYVGNGSKLEGFTLTGGSTRAAGDRSREQGGGGAWCDKRGVLVNCVVSTNRASVDGGGVHGGTLYGCQITGNVALDDGGGADSSTLFNCVLSSNHSGEGGGATDECSLYGCTLTGNSAVIGSGAEDCTLQNCIVYYNGPSFVSNFGNAAFNFCCTFPLPLGGTGNITNEPAFVDVAAGNYRLRAGSPCIDAGTNLSALVSFDFDGLPRPLDGNRDGIAAFDIGAYEFNPLFFTSIAKVGNNVRLCWFDTLAGMQLQAAESLNNPVWISVPFAPGTNCLELPLDSSNTFFRLLTP